MLKNLFLQVSHLKLITKNAKKLQIIIVIVQIIVKKYFLALDEIHAMNLCILVTANDQNLSHCMSISSFFSFAQTFIV